jgi:hypothetical protein
MTRPVAIIAVLAAGVGVLAGCGSDDPSAGRPATVDSNDIRAVALDCLTRVEGLEAREQGDDEIVVGADDTGPRIRVFLTSGEAEAEIFEGKAEGAEQIGATLLFVRQADDETLQKVEFCLDHQ